MMKVNWFLPILKIAYTIISSVVVIHRKKPANVKEVDAKSRTKNHDKSKDLQDNFNIHNNAPKVKKCAAGAEIQRQFLRVGAMNNICITTQLVDPADFGGFQHTARPLYGLIFMNISAGC